MHCLSILLPRDGSFDEFHPDLFGAWLGDFRAALAGGENPQGYEKDNPLHFVKNWKTPTLVIHGGEDYRVVDTEGMSTFTALQRKGIKSRFIFFPDEDHWVLKPQNSKLWHDEVLGWMDEFAKR